MDCMYDTASVVRPSRVPLCQSAVVPASLCVSHPATWASCHLADTFSPTGWAYRKTLPCPYYAMCAV